MPLEPKKVTAHDAIATPIEGRDVSFRTPNGTDEEVQSELDLWTDYLLQDIVNQQAFMNRRWVANPEIVTYLASFDGMNIQPTGPVTGSVASFGPSATHPRCTELATGSVAGQQYYTYSSTDSSRWSRPGVLSGMFSLESTTDVRFRYGVSSTPLFNFPLLPAKPQPGSWILTTCIFWELDTSRSPNLLIKWQNDFDGTGGFNSYDTGMSGLTAEQVYLFELELFEDGTVEGRVNREIVMPAQAVSLSDTRNLFPGATITSMGGAIPTRRLRAIQGSWNINYGL